MLPERTNTAARRRGTQAHDSPNSTIELGKKGGRVRVGAELNGFCRHPRCRFVNARSSGPFDRIRFDADILLSFGRGEGRTRLATDLDAGRQLYTNCLFRVIEACRLIARF